MKEQFIIAQLKEGDERAFRHIYDKHYALLYRYAFYERYRYRPAGDTVFPGAG